MLASRFAAATRRDEHWKGLGGRACTDMRVVVADDAQMMGSMDKESSFKLLDAFRNAGGNLIDTAKYVVPRRPR